MSTEEAVLGTLMKEPYLLGDSELKVDHFINHENRNIFSGLAAGFAKGYSVDMLTLLTQGNPEDFGGAGKLSRIQNLVITVNLKSP